MISFFELRKKDKPPKIPYTNNKQPDKRLQMIHLESLTLA